MTLELHPTADCWISLTVDGARIMNRIMKAGKRKCARCATRRVVEVGDAGAFAYSINGRPGKPLGVAGQVRTLKLTKGHDGRVHPVAAPWNPATARR
jgi:hypothetical protein